MPQLAMVGTTEPGGAGERSDGQNSSCRRRSIQIMSRTNVAKSEEKQIPSERNDRCKGPEAGKNRT